MTTWPLAARRQLPGADVLAAAIRAGTTAGELARTYGVGPTWVRQVVSRGGWSVRTGLPSTSRHMTAPRAATFMQTDSSWMDAGACRRRPDFSDIETTAQRLVCQPCPVQAECLKYALTQQITDGMWGGLTPTERTIAARGRIG